ncbi:T9SS type A sorting domain-containing protein [Hymenobacter tibetensis]|uniref:T9SS type A sorting domain-containing protein n=1 Tax=Hymenobacter tibetensis TaxID=497967 RepID=A0ABY4D307_9BACT|nr:T9SS type A sorting domain-containing protein [Hymenobacter tibetensis]UOG75885.1 T9SS type A sorting domain-containing protein [Hymenobacter tibetensis]
MKTRIQVWATAFRRLSAMLTGAALTIGSASAQVNNYTFTAASGTYTQLTGGTAVPALLTDDALSPAIQIGFPFAYDGTIYSQLQASSNGFLTFNTANTELGQENNLAGGAPARPLLAPLWDDLSGVPSDRGGAASYLTTGTAPNRVFTFEWRNSLWDYDAPAPSVSFQVKLYEGSNNIEFVYQPEGGALNSASASIGLGGLGSGTAAGTFVALSNASTAPTASTTVDPRNIAAVPAAGQIYRFAPPANVCGPLRNFTVSAVTTTTATLTFMPGAGHTSYTVTYTPTGGTPTTIAPAPTTSPIVITGLSASTTYALRIQANCASGVTGETLDRSFSTTPENDNPCNAIALPAPSSTAAPLSATNLGATTTTSTVAPGYTNPPPMGCGVAVNPKDVWFRFTTNATGAGSTTVGIATTGTAAGSIRVFSATSCSLGFTPVACKGGETNNTNAGSLNVTGLTPNTTYYVAVAPYATSDVQGPFTIAVGSTVLSTQQQLAKGEVSVFPNPTTTGQLTVRVSGISSLATAQVALLNTLGQVVAERTLSVRGGLAEQSLSTAALTKGIYMLRVQAGHETVVRKVVVE